MRGRPGFDRRSGTAISALDLVRSLAAGLAILLLTACAVDAETVGESETALASELAPTEVESTERPTPRSYPYGSVESGSAGEDGGGPSLVITFPQSGDVVNQPVMICYEIAGMEVDPSKPARLVAMIGTPPTVSHEFSVEGASGFVTLPDDPLLSGKRDITVQLEYGGEGDEGRTSVLIKDLIIEGDRAAGGSAATQCP